MIKRSSHHKIRRFDAPHPRRIVPTTPTEWKFVLFKHWSLSVCALRELSFVLDDSGELELDVFQNSISPWKTFCCKRSWPSRGELLRWGEQNKSKTQNESLSDAGETKVFCCLSKFYQFMWHRQNLLLRTRMVSCVAHDGWKRCCFVEGARIWTWPQWTPQQIAYLAGLPENGWISKNSAGKVVDENERCETTKFEKLQVYVTCDNVGI